MNDDARNHEREDTVGIRNTSTMVLTHLAKWRHNLDGHNLGSTIYCSKNLELNTVLLKARVNM
jgi:hypothetical protein